MQLNMFTMFKGSLIAMMVEAVSTSEMSVNFYDTTRRNIPEDNQLHTRRRENLKSHSNILYVLLTNTPCAHVHSFCATGVSSGLVTSVALTRVSRGRLRETYTGVYLRLA
jgi:hypothetical protein